MQALTDAVVSGVHDPMLEGVEVRVRDALEATAQDVLTSDGVVLGTAAHFGYMSGAVKHFFDTTFLDVGGSLDGGQAAASAGRRLPLGLYVHGRYDTTGAARSVLSLTGALGWREAAPVLEVLGDVTAGHLEAAYDLGATVAAQLT
jgi:NAD(P)H-dependent FMN reductase